MSAPKQQYGLLQDAAGRAYLLGLEAEDGIMGRRPRGGQVGVGRQYRGLPPIESKGLATGCVWDRTQSSGSGRFRFASPPWSRQGIGK